MEIFFTELYDNAFREIGKEENNEEEIGEYNRYPQMLPWVGKEYDNKNHKRILLVGESHYLPDCADEAFRTKEGWYYQEPGELDEESVSWTNTREVVGLGPKIWTKGHTLYREINKVIGNLEKQDYRCENMFKHVGYYNYFLRPAYPKGCSFKDVYEEQDLNIAYEAFCCILEIIEPEFVYFFSKFAWDSLLKRKSNFEGIKMDFSPHPACPWWNRKNYNLESYEELMTGKEKFSTFLEYNKIFWNH